MDLNKLFILGDDEDETPALEALYMEWVLLYNDKNIGKPYKCREQFVRTMSYFLTGREDTGQPDRSKAGNEHIRYWVRYLKNNTDFFKQLKYTLLFRVSDDTTTNLDYQHFDKLETSNHQKEINSILKSLTLPIINLEFVNTSFVKVHIPRTYFYNQGMLSFILGLVRASFENYMDSKYESFENYFKHNLKTDLSIKDVIKILKYTNFTNSLFYDMDVLDFRTKSIWSGEKYTISEDHGFKSVFLYPAASSSNLKLRRIDSNKNFKGSFERIKRKIEDPKGSIRKLIKKQYNVNM